AMFSAFDNRLTISTVQGKPKMLDVYYREVGRRNAVEALSGPDVGELVARLGGASDEGFHFTYGDIVAVLQSMTAAKTVPAAFVLETLPWVERELRGTPGALDEGRPQGETAQVNPSQHEQIGATLPEMPLPPQPKDKDKDSKEAKKDSKKDSKKEA